MTTQQIIKLLELYRTLVQIECENPEHSTGYEAAKRQLTVENEFLKLADDKKESE